MHEYKEIERKKQQNPCPQNDVPDGWMKDWLDNEMTRHFYAPNPKIHSTLSCSLYSPPSPWKDERLSILTLEHCNVVCESDNVIVVRAERENLEGVILKTFRFYYSYAGYYVGKYKPNGSSYPPCLDHNLVIGGKKYCVTLDGVEVGPEEVWAPSSAKFELAVTPWED